MGAADPGRGSHQGRTIVPCRITMGDVCGVQFLGRVDLVCVMIQGVVDFFKLYFGEVSVWCEKWSRSKGGGVRLMGYGGD